GAYGCILVYHMDVKSAFLYGNTSEEECNVSSPPCFVDLSFPNKVYKDPEASLLDYTKLPELCLMHASGATLTTGKSLNRRLSIVLARDLISWPMQKQLIVGYLYTEAEYVASCTTAVGKNCLDSKSNVGIMGDSMRKAHSVLKIHTDDNVADPSDQGLLDGEALQMSLIVKFVLGRKSKFGFEVGMETVDEYGPYTLYLHIWVVSIKKLEEILRLR
ncbi:hypothetical protein Tco_1168750, partial [Tanacetum coccineum]